MFGIGLAVLIGVTVIFDQLDPTKGTNASQSAADATAEISSDAPAPEHLTKLIDHCDAMAISHGMCGDLDKPVWKSLSSDTGEITRINMNSIQPGPYRGTAFAVIYIYPPGTDFSFDRVKQIYLTCRGQFADTSNASLFLDAPPGSVIGMVAAIVCPIAGAKGQASELQHQEAAIHESQATPSAVTSNQGNDSITANSIWDSEKSKISKFPAGKYYLSNTAVTCMSPKVLGLARVAYKVLSDKNIGGQYDPSLQRILSSGDCLPPKPAPTSGPITYQLDHVDTIPWSGSIDGVHQIAGTLAVAKLRTFAFNQWVIYYAAASDVIPARPG